MRAYGWAVKGLSSEPEGPGSSPETADFLLVVDKLYTNPCVSHQAA